MPNPPGPSRTRQCLTLGIVFAVTAALGIAASLRVARLGQWLPQPPLNIGPWEAIKIPIDNDTLNYLGTPPIENREYHSPLDERVTVQVVGPTSFDAYREPPELTQHAFISAQRAIPLFGPDRPLRASIWKSFYGDEAPRVMMYCWLQERSGRTQTFGMEGAQQSFWERLRISLSAIRSNDDRCIVRLFMPIPYTDETGAQSRRILDEIARGLHAYLTPQGGGR